MSAMRFAIMRVLLGTVAAARTSAVEPTTGESPFRAGAAKVDLAPPVGVPLGGYFARHSPLWPLPDPDHTNYTWRFKASTGVRDPVFVKALVLETAEVSLAHVTLDMMSADQGLATDAFRLASMQGFSIPWERVLFHASHTHSSFGGYSSEPVLELAALDKMSPAIRQDAARKVADAMLAAQSSVQPARLGIGQAVLGDVTCNRRAFVSPNDRPTSIDPLLGLLRVDSLDGAPLATLWNYPVHGTCLSENNLQISADIMGAASAAVEAHVGGIALFINSDAGDIAPSSHACGASADGSSASFPGGQEIAKAVGALRLRLSTTEAPQIQTASLSHEFGPTNANLSLFACPPQEISCEPPQGGTVTRQSPPSELCNLTSVLDKAQHLRLGKAFVNTIARFSAVRITIAGHHTLLVSIPGEAIHDLGNEIRGDLDLATRLRSDGVSVGFNTTMLLGYTNNYMFYFTTPKEYDIGGYEPQMSLWGRYDGEMVRQQCAKVAKLVAPTGGHSTQS